LLIAHCSFFISQPTRAQNTIKKSKKLAFLPFNGYTGDMTLTIDVEDEGVLTLLRDMERLDLLHVTPRNTVFPAPALPKMTEAEELEYINRNADRLNAEAEDVLSYQDLDL
jgi:hypothetical protein